MPSNLNEVAALQMVLKFISTEDLLKAAMNGFSEGETVKGKDNADICFKALEAFL